MVKTVLRMTMLVLSTTIIAQSAFPKPDSSMQCDGDSSQLFQRSFVGQGTHCVISLDLCWLCNWYFSDIISDTWLQFWPPGRATWPECKFGQQVAKLPSFQKLAIRLCHSYCHILPSIVLFPYCISVGIELVSLSARVTSVESTGSKCLCSLRGVFWYKGNYRHKDEIKGCRFQRQIMYWIKGYFNSNVVCELNYATCWCEMGELEGDEWSLKLSIRN